MPQVGQSEFVAYAEQGTGNINKKNFFLKMMRIRVYSDKINYK